MTAKPHQRHPLERLPSSRAQKVLKALTSYYGIALVIAIGCAYVFGWVADEVGEGEWGNMNSSILLSIHSHQSPTLDTIAFMVTGLGSTWGVLIIGGSLAIAMWMLQRYVDLVTFAAALLGASLMVGTFKLLFHQVRPQVFTPLVQESNYSFPSGHSLTSFALWGFVA
jgi:hypothetical protein